MNLLAREVLDKVKKAEAEIERINQDTWRLAFHLMPPVGWLNDPNGLCQKNGTYHVFFQYSPFDACGGVIVWGHYTSQDLLNWKYEGVSLVPDQRYDRDGVYSGSAFVENDQLHIFYTGNVKEDGNHDYIRSGRGSATIHAIGKEGTLVDGKTCVLTNSDYPKNYSCHVRDPKVWKEDQQYYMILGGRTLDDEGRALLYRSEDLMQWNFCNELKTNQTFGYMWECPDLFQMGEQYFLSISPQGLQKEETRFQNIYQSGYFYLDGDFRNEHRYKLRDFQEWDYGFDFYAPQTFLDEKGRRILIGWMGLPDIEDEYQNPTVEHGWQHALSMFREIIFKEGKVFQVPLKEYQKLRTNLIPLGNKNKVSGLSIFELELINEGLGDIILIFSDGLKLEFNQDKQLFSLEFINQLGEGRTVRRVNLEQLNSMRMFVDTSAIEVYLNDGEKVFSTRYYNKNKENSIQIEEGEVDIKIWELQRMNVDFHDNWYNKAKV